MEKTTVAFIIAILIFGSLVYYQVRPHERQPTTEEINQAKIDLNNLRVQFNALNATEQQAKVDRGGIATCYEVKDYCTANPNSIGCINYCSEYLKGIKDWDYVMPKICDKPIANGQYTCWS